MTQKKSAARLKIADAKVELTEEQMNEQLQKILDDAKLAIDKSISIQIEQTMRFDNLLAIHDSFIRFGFDECRIDKARSVANRMRHVLADIQVVVAGLGLDAMAAKEYVNPIDGYVPKTEEDDGWEEVLADALVFSAIRPWGENLDNLHQQLITKAYEIGYYKDGE